MEGYRTNLDQYDIGDRQWDWVWYALLPEPPYVSWGGALACIPNPHTSNTGWIFLLKGNNTREFYVHTPGDLTGWHTAESMPDEVEAGGALCFGGIHGLGGPQGGWAYLYAFSGKEEIGLPAARFFRYKFSVAGDGTDGEWEPFPSLPEPSGEGAALTWVQLPDDPTALGNVMALPGGGSQHIYKFDASKNSWEEDAFADYPVWGGGAMATGPGGSSVWCFPGGGEQNWWLYDVHSRRFRYFTGSDRTPLPQNPGTAMAPMPYEGTSFLYAEFGQGQAFYRFNLEDEGGGQGGNTKSAPMLTVEVRPVPRMTCFVFRIRTEEPSPITMRLFDAAGKLVKNKRCAVVSSSETVMVWSYRDAASGVYYWDVQSNNASVSGKLTVIK